MPAQTTLKTPATRQPKISHPAVARFQKMQTKERTLLSNLNATSCAKSLEKIISFLQGRGLVIEEAYLLDVTIDSELASRQAANHEQSSTDASIRSS